MKRTHVHRVRGAIALIAALSLVTVACGDDDDTADSAPAEDTAESAPAEDTAESAPAEDTAESAPAEESAPADSGEPVTIDWWHIQNNDPGKADWQAMADAFTAEHPNVTIDITVMENEAFKAALQTNLQAGDVPDLFQSWGGGALRDQVAAGLVQDITEPTSGWIGDLGAAPVGLYQVDGKQYGVPFDAGIVGFWYNKDLFAQAGSTSPGGHLGRAARRRSRR